MPAANQERALTTFHVAPLRATNLSYITLNGHKARWRAWPSGFGRSAGRSSSLPATGLQAR